MDDGNYTDDAAKEETFEPFTNLCQVLIAVWFTAFIIMVGDVLILRNARFRAEHRQAHLIRRIDEETEDTDDSEEEINGFIYLVQEVGRNENDVERDESDENEDIENIGDHGGEASRQNEIEEKFVNTRTRW